MKNNKKILVSMVVMIIIGLICAFIFYQKKSITDTALVSSRGSCDITYKVPDFFKLKEVKDGEEKYVSTDASYGDFTVPDGPYSKTYDGNGNSHPVIQKDILIKGAELTIKKVMFTATSTKEKFIVDKENYYALEGDVIMCKRNLLTDGFDKVKCSTGFESTIIGTDTSLVGEKCAVSFDVKYNLFDRNNIEKYEQKIGDIISSVNMKN